MLRDIFKPGKGQVPARFIAAYVNGSAVYRGDLVCWDITAPTDQGSSGVLAGETLATDDFIFVILPPATDAAAQGLQAGVIEGTHVGDRRLGATANVLINDKIAIVQTWGVHDNVWVDSSSTTKGSLLTTGATTGECTWMLATDANGTDATIGVGGIVGFALTDDATTHVRAASTTEEGCVAFIRCDF